MSWSIDLIGNQHAIVYELVAKSGPMAGDSKVEYDAALPHIIGLVEQNWSMDYPCVLRVTANGHGVGEKARSLNVQVQRVNAELLYPLETT